MAGPWEQYQQAAPAPAAAGPWTEYDQRERRRPAPEPMDVDPSEGMTGGQKLLVGVGSSMDKAYRGIKGLFGGDTSQGDADAAVYQKYRPKGWETTAGEVIGDVASYAPAALIPGGLPMQIAAGAASSAALTPGSAEERLQAAGMGGAGAVGGHVLAKTLGRLAKPIGDKAADTVALEAHGVEPTFGQGMAAKGTATGRAIGRAEEGAMSVPIASGPLRRTREQAMDQWRQATRDAALPPGAAPVGSVDEVRQAFTRSYDALLDPLPMPYSSVTYQPDIRRLTRGQALSNEQRQMVADVFHQTRLEHMQNPVGIQPTAAAAQHVESELKTRAAKFMASQDPSQQELGHAFNKLAKDFGNTWRGALPQNTRSEIAAIDRAYPGFKAIQQAAKTVGATASDAVPSNYTPAVLTRAARTTDRSPGKGRYIRGEAAQQELARLGQGLQGRVPDSGTTERALLGGGALGGLWLDPVSTIGAGAALAGYGTRPVQNYLMGRAAPAEQEAILRWMREMAPYMAAGGASQTAD